MTEYGESDPFDSSQDGGAPDDGTAEFVEFWPGSKRELWAIGQGLSNSVSPRGLLKVGDPWNRWHHFPI